MSSREVKQWITIKGRHIPIYEGESKAIAVKRFTQHTDRKMSSSSSSNTSSTSSTSHTTTSKKQDSDTKHKESSVSSKMTRLQRGGNVDLFHRPQIDASKLKDAGWKDAGTGTATVFSSTYSNSKGNKAGNFTPIRADKDGKFIEILTPEDLAEYAEAVMEGEIEDYLGLQIGEFTEGEDAIEQAEELAEEIHELQEEYYLKKSNL